MFKGIVSGGHGSATRVDQVREGLRLLPSPLPIARRAVVVKLPTPADRRVNEQRPALPDAPLRHRITEDGLDRLRDACPVEGGGALSAYV
jgi:hypothetical protein